MRESRTSGSEGGGTEFNRFPLPLLLATLTAPARQELRWVSREKSGLAVAPKRLR
jgi:hypothetical protein